MFGCKGGGRGGSGVVVVSGILMVLWCHLVLVVRLVTQMEDIIKKVKTSHDFHCGLFFVTHHLPPISDSLVGGIPLLEMVRWWW